MLEQDYNKKVLLYSGGMDSWLISKIWKPDIKLYIDTNTNYSKSELNKLDKDVIVEQLDLSRWEHKDKIIPLRNLYFISLATNYGNEICLGATYGDRVLDKSQEFADKATDLLTYLYSQQHWTTERKISINLDYKRYTKTELLRIYLKNGGDIKEALERSFSCYFPINKKECWQCKACFRKFIAFTLNSYKFSDEVIRQNVFYISQNIKPDIDSGIYDRGREEQDILKVLNMYKGYV